jgi:tetratricopeptide (TPR) repeat protein
VAWSIFPRRRRCIGGRFSVNRVPLKQTHEDDTAVELPLSDRVRLRVGKWLSLAGGLVHTIGGRPQAAEEAYRDALLCDPASDTAGLMLGDSLEKQERWEEAAAVYAGMAERDPSHENAFYHRACCLVKLNRVEEAATECRRAIQAYPKHHAAYVLLGQVLESQGRPAEAREALSKALSLKPRSPEVQALLEKTSAG